MTDRTGSKSVVLETMADKHHSSSLVRRHVPSCYQIRIEDPSGEDW